MGIMLYSLALIAGLGFIFMIFKIRELKHKLKEPYLVYVDTGGINKNPPAYIDTWRGKTINFKLDKYIVTISQLPFLMCLNHMRQIENLFRLLKENLEYKSESKQDKILHQIKYVTIYKTIIQIIYKLSKRFVDNKHGYKKALYKKAKQDVTWMMDVIEQTLDYWGYVKKKINLLAKGSTLRQMGGENFTWNSLEMDRQGKILLKPRFALPSNISSN